MRELYCVPSKRRRRSCSRSRWASPLRHPLVVLGVAAFADDGAAAAAAAAAKTAAGGATKAAFLCEEGALFGRRCRRHGERQVVSNHRRLSRARFTPMTLTRKRLHLWCGGAAMYRRGTVSYSVQYPSEARWAGGGTCWDGPLSTVSRPCAVWSRLVQGSIVSICTRAEDALSVKAY